MKTASNLLLAASAAAAVLFLPSAAGAARPANPCLVPATAKNLRCPDLVMRHPFGLAADPLTRPGHVLLRAGNSIDNVGTGAAELVGVRDARYGMAASQRIYRRGGGKLSLSLGARLIFKDVPSRGGTYWKFFHAAQFDLYRLNAKGERIQHARRGPKVAYCLRDLKHTAPGRRFSPRRFVYPACNQSFRTRTVRLGTSVGWSDIYPPSYPEQYIDVTGLRGCFAYTETADPRNGIYESNEANNTATVVVRLPYREGRQRCPGASRYAPGVAPPGRTGY